MVKGKIHSLESMGLVDGPGIRAVVFFGFVTILKAGIVTKAMKLILNHFQKSSLS